MSMVEVKVTSFTTRLPSVCWQAFNVVTNWVKLVVEHVEQIHRNSKFFNSRTSECVSNMLDTSKDLVLDLT